MGRQPQSSLRMKRKEEEELEERFREIMLSYSTHDSHSPAKMVPKKMVPIDGIENSTGHECTACTTTVWPSSIILMQDASSTTLAAT